MNNYFIILASGQSKRFNSSKPKQYIIYKNKPLFDHSVEKALASKLFKKIILVVNNKKQINKKYSKSIIILKGGKERSDSSLIGLKIFLFENNFIKGPPIKSVIKSDVKNANPVLKVIYLKTFKNEKIST